MIDQSSYQLLISSFLLLVPIEAGIGLRLRWLYSSLYKVLAHRVLPWRDRVWYLQMVYTPLITKNEQTVVACLPNCCKPSNITPCHHCRHPPVATCSCDRYQHVQAIDLRLPHGAGPLHSVLFGSYKFSLHPNSLEVVIFRFYRTDWEIPHSMEMKILNASLT